MSWRIVSISSRAKLDLRMGYMVVRTDETIKIHLSEISVLLIESTSVSLTTALINELINNKIKVIFCDEKHNPSSELVPFYGCHNSSEKIRNQINWKNEVKESVWTLIVFEKINNQAKLLNKLGLDGCEKLNQYSNELEFNDSNNREAMAAKVYFHSLFGMNFSRENDSTINKCLNYGYGVLLSVINREITACGYLTQLGIHHSNIYNHFNLGSDLIEPFRVLVDEYVYEMNPTDFSTETKRKILSLLNNEYTIDSRKQTLNNVIKIYTKSILDSLSEEDTTLIRFCSYEL